MTIGGAVYSTHIVLFFLIGLIPAFFLNAYVRKKVDNLDSGLGKFVFVKDYSSLKGPVLTPTRYVGTSGPYQSDILQATSRIDASMTFKPDISSDLEVLEEGSGIRSLPKVELPKDRPFANLTSTSILPMAYASILKCHVDPKEKARRLRKALRRDNLQLLAYFIMLAFLGSLAFFQAAQGEPLTLRSSNYQMLQKIDCFLTHPSIFRSCSLGLKEAAGMQPNLAILELRAAGSAASCRFLVRCCRQWWRRRRSYRCAGGNLQTAGFPSSAFGVYSTIADSRGC